MAVCRGESSLRTGIRRRDQPTMPPIRSRVQPMTSRTLWRTFCSDRLTVVAIAVKTGIDVRIRRRAGEVGRPPAGRLDEVTSGVRRNPSGVRVDQLRGCRGGINGSRWTGIDGWERRTRDIGRSRLDIRTSSRTCR